MSQKAILGVVVASLVVIALAFFATQNPADQAPAGPGDPNPADPSGQPATLTLPTLPARTVTAAEVKQLIASNPYPDTSPAKSKAYSDAVADAAVDSAGLDIKMCEPNPAVLRVELGSSLLIGNTDNTQHQIVLNAGETQIKESLAPGEVRKVALQLPSAGIYGYSCDANLSAGIFLVVAP